MANVSYQGRMAPSPTGYLHRGHRATFEIARDRARDAGGRLLLRMEDLDSARCKPEFITSILEDLIRWDLAWEGEPVYQSRQNYLPAWEKLLQTGCIYPCNCSRKDVATALGAPHHGEVEHIYPGTCRDKKFDHEKPGGWNWRFRVPQGERIEFMDLGIGLQTSTAGIDFGDFLVWRKDRIPAYEFAVVVDDAAMGITEVVRGEDLIKSTFRQLLVYRALDLWPPKFYHCPLVRDETGRRISKRDGLMRN